MGGYNVVYNGFMWFINVDQQLKQQLLSKTFSVSPLCQLSLA